MKEAKFFLIITLFISAACIQYIPYEEDLTSNPTQEDEPSIVYFTRNLSATSLVEIYKKLNVTLQGKVAIKVHSGEALGSYFLRPAYLDKLSKHVGGTFVENNAAYEETRHTSAIHNTTAHQNGWHLNNRTFEILDFEDEERYLQTTFKESKLKNMNYVGSKLYDYDSTLVVSHFKGHEIGGYGGAFKQLSIGYASQQGKTWIHTCSYTKDWHEMMAHLCGSEDFTEAMAEAASSIIDYFKQKNRGGLAYINVIKDVSIQCDCTARPINPRINDIGIVASLDPVAIDQFSLDLVLGSEDEGVKDWKEQFERLNGSHTLEVAEKNGYGKRKYKVIDLDAKSSCGWLKLSGIVTLILTMILI